MNERGATFLGMCVDSVIASVRTHFAARSAKQSSNSDERPCISFFSFFFFGPELNDQPPPEPTSPPSLLSRYAIDDSTI